jgi:hypothetical protein
MKSVLKNILSKSKINHKKEIINCETIKDSHIYCKVNNISGNITGTLIEHYIKQKHNMTKNNVSLCIGDLAHNGTNIEIKVSNGGQTHNKFNYVQIRLNHNCDYLLTAYYLDNSNVESCGELFIFILTKNDIKELLLKYGSYAHGTVKKLGKITKEDLDDINNSKEYAFRPKYNDNCWKSLLKFRIDENSI